MSYESPITMVSELINTQLRQDGDRYVADIEKKVGFHVDKQELIKALAYDRDQYQKGYDDAMKRRVGEWIPVSEGLPERDVSVLAYHRNISFDYQYVSWIDEYSGEWSGFIGSLPDEVLAWMPLPEPYKAESEGEE